MIEGHFSLYICSLNTFSNKYCMYDQEKNLKKKQHQKSGGVRSYC